MRKRTHCILLLLLMPGAGLTAAESVAVNYQQEASREDLHCHGTLSSSILTVCHQPEYLLLKFTDSYSQHCGAPAAVVASLLQTPTPVSFYDQNVRGRYQCGSRGAN